MKARDIIMKSFITKVAKEMISGGLAADKHKAEELAYRMAGNE